jgi:antitoxin component of MazEF toxin-antitoxin module
MVEKPKYVHVVKHSSADTLVTTIPRSYCKELQLSKGDILVMKLDGKRVIMEKA